MARPTVRTELERVWLKLWPSQTLAGYIGVCRRDGESWPRVRFLVAGALEDKGRHELAEELPTWRAISRWYGYAR